MMVKIMKSKLDYYIINIKAFFINIIFSKSKINNKKIVVDNFLGKGFGDNVKYLVEELHRMNHDIEFIWIVRNMKEKTPDYVKKVRYASFKSLYEYATAKIWIDNVRNNIKTRKKVGQVYLQTWHGPFSSKKVEKMAEKTLTKEYIKEAKKDGSIVDGILSNSKMQDEQYIKYFWINKNVEILKYGFPRNDYLMKNQNNVGLKNDIKKYLGINGNYYIILYAPTFRDDFSMDGYKIDFKKVVKSFSKKENKKVKLLIRLHPNVQKYSKFINYDNDIIDVTLYPNMQDLTLICDAVVSDYSSTLFDFAIQYKPAFICAIDLKKYMNTRGLVEEYFNYPFPFAKTNSELINNILNFDYLKYENNLNEFFKKYPIYDKGNATEKICLWIIDKIKEKGGKKW